MNNLSAQKKIPLKWLVTLSVVFLLIILVVGLKPRGFRFFNKVNWINSQPGMRFSGFGIAYTDPLGNMMAFQKSDTNGFSIEIALKPESYRGRRFKFILAIDNGKDSEQLVVGQWRSWLIVMNGDDYAHKKKINRVSADLASTSPATIFVAITSGQEGTRIFFDGKPVVAKKDLRLKIPAGGKTRLILGNSVYGKHPWRGDVYGLALYNYQLFSQEAASHFIGWSLGQNFAFARNEKPSMLYLFDEKGGTIALDHAEGRHHLELPSMMRVFEPRVLSLPAVEFMSVSGFIKDIVVNLLGFMPLGFVLFATLVRFGGTFDRRAILFTVVFCFFVSLFIEILQSWIPSRTSSILDLVLNTLGGWVGAIGCRFFATVQRFRVPGSKVD